MKSRGFTLIELLAVIAILAIVVAVGVPVISSVTEKAKISADRITAQQIETCINAWMNTEYSNANFFRRNLYGSTSTGVGATGRIYGYTEQMYSYYFAGTGQLPGVELIRETEIRHSVITAIKATSNMKLDARDGEQFVPEPDAGVQFGYKYYYKIGRVSVERTDSTESVLGNDEVYRYYVWLDRTGGNISTETQEKHYKEYTSLYVGGEALYAFRFDFGMRAVENIRVEIEKDGQIYTMLGKNETPGMFKPGVYNMRFYYNGDLYRIIRDCELATGGDTISAA